MKNDMQLYLDAFNEIPIPDKTKVSILSCCCLAGNWLAGKDFTGNIIINLRANNGGICHTEVTTNISRVLKGNS